MLLADFWTSFVLGLLTPLTAVCVLPLYPAFLSFLSSKFSGKEKKSTLILFGGIIVGGVIAFMLVFGLIFTTFFQASLTNVIGIVSPIAFGLLGIVSIMLIFNFDFSKVMPQMNLGVRKNPLWSAFLFGFFFGAIVIPCNPGFIIAFLARTTLSTDFISSMTNFLGFGIGLGFPLLVFSLVSAQWSQKVIGFLTKHKRKINLIAGVVMLWVALYYLLCVFNVVELGVISAGFCDLNSVILSPFSEGFGLG